MATAADVLSIAEAEVGYSRWDDPEKGTKYGRWYAGFAGEEFGESGVPYCAMFVSWVLDQAGVSCAGIPGAYCPHMLEAAREAEALVSPEDAQPGDLIYYEWDGGLKSDHMGIIVVNHDGTRFETIEGNTSPDAGGSQSNGGVVAHRERIVDYVCGIVRPTYDEPGAPA